MKAAIYNQSGKEAGSIDLPENLFGLPWNDELVHQVVTSMASNARHPIAHTKTRGEVSGTGKKPWKQKGTGRARHGSRRSPIWVGGGIAHGPRNDKKFDRKINKKMKTKALFTVLSKKYKDGEVVFIDSLSFETPKSSEAKKILSSLSKVETLKGLARKKNAAFVATAEKNENAYKSFRNFGNLEFGMTKDLSPIDMLKYKFLVIAEPEKSINTLASRVGAAKK